MTARAVLLIPCLCVAGLFAGWPAAASGAVSAKEASVAIALDRDRVATRLGERFSFTSRVKNEGAEQLSGLVAHLNVVGLSEGIYVDPEDWSEQRTKHLPSLAPGADTSVSWSVKAVTGGEAAIYVVVLPGKDPPSASEGLAVSPALDVRIAERRTLNSGGVLPLALGVPALIGATTLLVRARGRRREGARDSD
jgi:hypothetical protein